MTALTPIPAGLLDPPADFVAAVQPQDLVYFCCNVGDADAQLILVPERPPHSHRRAIVVDAGRSGKIDRLLDLCAAAGLLPVDAATGRLAPQAIALVVATHPHADHIGGMPRLLDRYGDSVAEFWDSGYWHPIGAFHDTMREIERRQMLYMQPSSGTRRWIHQTLITVLAPAVHLRNRFDSYGIEINNSSISLRVDYPAARVLRRNNERVLLDRDQSVRLILGGDAQTESWAHVGSDFPQLFASGNAAARAIGAASGVDHLNADVLKVSHHASDRGVNFELVRRIGPKVTIVSSGDRSPRYNFPHHVSQELLREALQSTEGIGQPRRNDWELGLFYTADTADAPPANLGTIAMRLRPDLRELWRLGDDYDDVTAFDLSSARRWSAPL